MNILSFFIGVAFGACAFMAYGTYQVFKLKKTTRDLVSRLKEEIDKARGEGLGGLPPEKSESIIERLKQASKLSEEQMDIRALAEMPSKNSLHSKYKNSMIRQIQELEEQKLSILRTVLGDGYDPLITITREGGVKEDILLSAYVTQAEDILRTVDSSGPPPKPEGALSEPRKVGKFVIYKGGNNDEGTTH